MNEKRVLLLLTGGTLGSAATDPADDTYRPVTGDEFARRLNAALPELPEIATVNSESLMALDSSDIGADEWLQIARVIRDRDREFDGVVIAHGTDTMAHTASALSFLLPALDKPIVLTGSQRPLAEPRSDARINLIDAVTVATLPVPEVTVVFHSQMLRGNRCRKGSSEAYNAFTSPNAAPLGELGVHVELNERLILPRRGVPGMPPRLLEALERRVGTAMLTPATRAQELSMYHQLGTRGLVLLAFGAGNVPLARGIREALGELLREGVAIVALSQCFEGATGLGIYEGGKALLDLGVIDGGDMTPEAALTKLMVGLGAGLEGGELRRYMHQAVAGERKPLD